MNGRRIAAVCAATTAVAALVAVVVGRQVKSSAVEARREVYANFPVFPGAHRFSEVPYQIKEDGRGTGRYGLRVTYELPLEAKSAAVIDFYRARKPASWSEASDDTCLRVLSRMPAPPQTTSAGQTASIPNPQVVLPSSFVLMFRQSQLTVFMPGGDVGNGAQGDGVTVALARSDGRKLVTLDQAVYSCGPLEVDKKAAEFDAP
jgi:hypothetical protein